MKQITIDDLMPLITKKSGYNYVFVSKLGQVVLTEHKPILDKKSERGWKLPDEYRWEGFVINSILNVDNSVEDWSRSLRRINDESR